MRIQMNNERICKTKNEQTNKPSQCCLRVSILGIFYWGINTINKKNGMGPGEGGSGRVASGLSASSRRGHESVNLNLYWGNLT
jgi:hypothetical protein